MHDYDTVAVDNGLTVDDFDVVVVDDDDVWWWYWISLPY